MTNMDSRRKGRRLGVSSATRTLASTEPTSFSPSASSRSSWLHTAPESKRGEALNGPPRRRYSPARGGVMAIRKIKNHGKWVWQARVAYRGLRRATFRPSKDEARQAESDLLGALKAESAQAEQQGQRPATLRQLLEFYALDMRARGKGEASVCRVDYTRRSIEAL